MGLCQIIKMVDAVVSMCRGIHVVAFSIMSMAVLAQIIFRTMGFTVLAMDDLAVFTFLWLIYTGVAVAFHQKDHVKMEFFMALFPENWQRVGQVITDFLIMIFLILFSISGVYLILNNFQQHGMQLKISMAWVYLILPVAGLASFLTVLSHTLQDIKQLRSGEPKA